MFSSQSLQWYFAVTERTLAYESLVDYRQLWEKYARDYRYLEYYVVLAECTIIIVLNVASFVKLKQLHSMVPALNFQFASDQFQITKNKCTTASEQRLFMQVFRWALRNLPSHIQSVCQLIPLTSVMILFFFITPLCESAFLAFLCSTAAWHFGIALDGLARWSRQEYNNAFQSDYCHISSEVSVRNSQAEYSESFDVVPNNSALANLITKR